MGLPFFWRISHGVSEEAATRSEQAEFSEGDESQGQEFAFSAHAWRLAVVARVPCFRPLKAYWKPGGGIAFTAKAGWYDRHLELPCGQCVGCRLERSRQWALRCVHEAQMHERNCFVTLTYSPECLPDDGSLHVEDWQKFAKRVRKRLGPFRFFHCGEYGEESFRPHYHACMFGVDFSEDRVPLKKERGNTLYRSDQLEDLWSHGFATVGSLTWQSAAYVARYCMKKATGKLGKERYARVDVQTGEVSSVRPEYVTMSRRPGIGSEWFEQFASDVYPADEVVHEGKRYRPPRFYDLKLPREELEVLKTKRRKAAGSHEADLSGERLEVREKVAAAQVSGLHRKI